MKYPLRKYLLNKSEHTPISQVQFHFGFGDHEVDQAPKARTTMLVGSNFCVHR